MGGGGGSVTSDRCQAKNAGFKEKKKKNEQRTQKKRKKTVREKSLIVLAKGKTFGRLTKLAKVGTGTARKNSSRTRKEAQRKIREGIHRENIQIPATHSHRQEW